MLSRKATLFLAIVLGLAVGLYFAFRRGRPDNVKAVLTLRTILYAEVEFREKDRDSNGIQDFWTGDVASLYRFGLIPREIAEADAFPITPLVERPKPYYGYYFAALEWDDSDGEDDRHGSLKVDTDGKSGKVHHLSKVAVCAFPAYPNPDGESYMRTYLKGAGGLSAELGGMTNGKPVLRWPNLRDLKKNWGILD